MSLRPLRALVPLVLISQSFATTSVAAGSPALIYSNDVLGEIEPCGCRTNPLGGMARKANLMSGDPRIKGAELLQLDAGDLLLSTGKVPEMLAKQSEVQAESLVQTLNLTGLNAAVPGEKDFGLGFKAFERLKAKARFKFLAANLSRIDGKPFLEAHSVFSFKDPSGKPLRVGVIGLVGQDLPWPKELRATNINDAARRGITALKGKVDLIIALTHQGYDKDVALSKAVRGIDIIVGGHTQTFVQEPVKTGETLIYQSSFRNQYVGFVPLRKPFTGEGHELIGLGTEWESPAGKPSRIDQLTTEAKAQIAKLNTEAETQFVREFAKQEAVRSPTFQTFPRCAECHLKQFDFWRKTNHMRALTPLIEAQQEKNKECLSCHTVGLGEKDGFHKVTVLGERKKKVGDTLSESEIEPIASSDLAKYLKAVHEAKSLNTEVKVGDFKAVRLEQSVSQLNRVWTPVQCENCHQPGRDHPFSVDPYKKTVETNVCLKCHTAERAPEWYTPSKQPDWDKIALKRKLVACPSGDFEASETK